MKHVRVTLAGDGPDAGIHPVYGVLADAPFVGRATALQWNFTGEDLAVLHSVEGDAAAFDAAVSDLDPVVGVEVEPTGGDGDAFYAYVRAETTEGIRRLVAPITAAGILVVPPVVFHEDGRFSASLLGPGEAVGAACETIRGAVDVTVRAVGGLSAVPPVVETRLTDRQREALEVALELGYYDAPREADGVDVAAALDCASSTAAEHLRKAEATIVRSVLRSA